MTAILKVKVEELTAGWLEQIKANYGDAEVEVHIREESSPSMREELFWAILDQLDWAAVDNAGIIEPAVQQLSTCTLSQIYAFQELLAQKLYQLDTPEHARHIGAAAFSEGRYFSVDYFLYARACVVAHGKAVFDEVLLHPSENAKRFDFRTTATHRCYGL
ncbi:MAG: DUF4240 domain-containing protein [Saprospiraceae bacterium]|nr:DUF4240 domain-containing protein [Saprospiraceae bacterium]